METFKNSPSVNTDLAWNKLLTRFKQDGLVPQKKVLQSAPGYPVWIKWAATFLLLIAAGSFYYLGFMRTGGDQMLALRNGGEDVTLVKTLDDGSVVYLANNTQLSLPRHFDTDERRVRLQGEAFFDVSHDPMQPFRIEASNALIEVMGTSFSVKTFSEGQLEVYVEEGLVRVNLGGDQEVPVMVTAGEVLQVDGQQYQKAPANDLLLAMWRHDRMHFKDESLENILRVINRNYNVSLMLQDPALGKRQLTVTFFNNSLSTITELICLSMNLEARNQSDSSILLVPR